uniref:Eukaryotic translation initiation factor 3 subunit J n=1 Tax=Kalanchoe fedtschenkoi TaxID=63787 RepID=A0A7N0U4B4_KALFE
MDDWEDQPAPPVLKKELLKSSWEDEDAEDDEVKDSWEDEDESTPPPVVAAPEPKPTKVSKKSDVKVSGRQVKLKEDVKEEALDPVAEKLRQQRLVEESDYKFTTALFGKKDDEKSLDTFIPKSESDFAEYAELISHKLRPYEKSFHYLGLLKAVMRLSMVNLRAADAKEVASSVTAIANEKLKAEKEANAGKKKTAAKKKQLQVDKPDDEAGGVYDALDDDYDFM